MAISKAFAYNTGGPISGTTQYGDIVVGDILANYGDDYGGLKWWGGPDEELGYVVGNARPDGQSVPAGVTGGPAYVGFFRSTLLTDESFLSLANYIGEENSEPPFASTEDAVTWLNANGYYTSYSGGTPIVTGYYYIGGSFTVFDTIPAPKLVSLNTNGSKDSTFNIGSGFNSAVYSTSIQSDGKILVGGDFTTFTGSSQNRLIRLNSDGSKDSTFNIGSGFNVQTNSIKIQSDGKILVGGNFTTFSGSSQNYLIRLNSDGSKDSTFNIGSGFDGPINSIAIQSDGKILVGGNFYEFSGESQIRLIRLNSDGSKDSTFNIGSGFDGPINSIAIQSDEKILVGGSFSNGLIRLNTNGSIDTSLDIGSGFSIVYYGISSISIQTDGKILVGGNFYLFSGESQNYLIRLNSDGSKDETFDIGDGFSNPGGGSVSSVISTEIQSDGKILVGGDFTVYQGSEQFYYKAIRLNSDGSKDSTFDIGSGFLDYYDTVYSIAIQSNGNILFGGQFFGLAGSSQNYLIKLNSNGSKDTSFNIGSGFNEVVQSIAIQSDGKILAGGSFSTFTGSSQNGLIRLNTDGSKDTSFDIGSGFFGPNVESLEIQSDGKILAVGNFFEFTGSSQSRLIRLNSDGSKDTSFDIGSGFNGPTNSIAIQSDGKILVGGVYTTYQGSSQNSLIRLNSNGSKDSTFNIGTGFNTFVYGIPSIAIQTDGKILVGGDFTSYSGISLNLGLIRLNSDGSKDTSFDTGSGGQEGNVFSIAIQSDGKILVGGDFFTFTGSSQNFLIRLNSDGSKDETFDIGSGFNNAVRSIEIQSDGKILVGGFFTTYNTSSSLYSVILNSDGSFNSSLNFNALVYSIKII